MFIAYDPDTGLHEEVTPDASGRFIPPPSMGGYDRHGSGLYVYLKAANLPVEKYGHVTPYFYYLGSGKIPGTQITIPRLRYPILPEYQDSNGVYETHVIFVSKEDQSKRKNDADWSFSQLPPEARVDAWNEAHTEDASFDPGRRFSLQNNENIKDQKVKELRIAEGLSVSKRGDIARLQQKAIKESAEDDERRNE